MDGGKPGGTDTQVLQTVADKLGYDLQISEIPWKRCLEMAQSGDMDIAYSTSYKDDRAAYLIYPKIPIHETSYVVVVKSGIPYAWDEKKDVTKLPQPIGSVLGFSVTTELNKVSGLNVDSGAVTDQQNIEKFKGGRLNAIVIEKTSFESIWPTSGSNMKIEVLNPPYEDAKKYYLTVSKKALGDPTKAQVLADGIDKIVGEMQKDGSLANIYK